MYTLKPTASNRSVRALFLALFLLTAGPFVSTSNAEPEKPEKPNILLLCGEDLGPHIGPYGDPYAETPNIDAFASKSLTYNIAWSNSPVCAPARTTLATGMYAPALGGQHMRSWVRKPSRFKMYPRILRQHGYNTINHGKEDYNVSKDGKLWTSDQRLSGAVQPFFMKLNFGSTHEGYVAHAKAQVEGDVPRYDLPAFHPDIQEAHRNWATYYHQISRFDRWVHFQLQKLRENNLLQNTIVIIWGDHGPGLPRGKRFTRDFGLHVPLIVYVPPALRDRLAPDAYNPGHRTDRLVSFVDFGPTFLSLAGIEPPEHMHGKAFMGKHEDDPKSHLFGFRGRMDERIDMTRTIRTERYQLIRNYMPHRRYGQYVEFLHQNPTMDRWLTLYEQGKIDPPVSFYWQEKPPVELYDLKNDPDQVHNLAYSPEHQDVRNRLMKQLHEHQATIRDTGFLPEGQIHSRTRADQTPYEMARNDDQYPFKAIRGIAERAAGRSMADVPELVRQLDAEDPALPYWAATGLLVRGPDAVWPHRDRLRNLMLSDRSPAGRVVAAECLARYGTKADRDGAVQSLLTLANPRKSTTFTSIAALNTLDKLDPSLLLPHQNEINNMPDRPENEPRRVEGYTVRLLKKIRHDLRRAN